MKVLCRVRLEAQIYEAGVDFNSCTPSVRRYLVSTFIGRRFTARLLHPCAIFPALLCSCPPIRSESISSFFTFSTFTLTFNLSVRPPRQPSLHTKASRLPLSCRRAITNISIKVIGVSGIRLWSLSTIAYLVSSRRLLLRPWRLCNTLGTLSQTAQSVYFQILATRENRYMKLRLSLHLAQANINALVCPIKA